METKSIALLATVESAHEILAVTGQIEVSWSTVYNIIHKELQLYRFETQHIREHEYSDYAVTKSFALKFCARM